jgi:hypothetical protein
MRARTAVVTGIAALLTLVRADAQGGRSENLNRIFQQIKADLPKGTTLLTALSTAGPSPETAALPKPSLKEPFEIGEALFDPGRIEDGVVSLLALMHIDVVPDAGAAQNGRGLVLSTSEVRTLADMGREDLESSTDIENLPYSFTDLHAAVAELLPAVSLEQMAAAYTRAYEMDPDDVIAKALMGRPIEPEIKLTRTQMWFLLMDGFAGAAAGDARWGAADRQLPDLRSPNAQWSAAEWREVLARLPLVSADRLLAITAPDVITQGTAPRPAPVNITMRANASAVPLVSRSTGRTLIAARAGSLAGQDVTWHVRDDSALMEIGTIASPLDTPERIGANGIAQFVIQPGVAATGSTGQLVDDWEAVQARVETRGVVAAAYAVPASLAPLTLGTSAARANLHLRWRSPDVLILKIASFFAAVNFQIPGVGGGTRTGIDQVGGYLYKRRDGSYVGTGLGEGSNKQTLRGGIAGGPAACATSDTKTKQWLRVRVTPVTGCGSAADCASAASVMNAPPQSSPPGAMPAAPRASAATGFGPAHRLEDYVWWDGPKMSVQPPDGGYYRVELFPVTKPDGPENPCIPFIRAEADRRGYGASLFIPFNDAQWTTPGQGYGIALKAGGPTFYSDLSSQDPLGGTPLAGVKTLFQLTGQTMWAVIVGRTEKEFEEMRQKFNAALQ